MSIAHGLSSLLLTLLLVACAPSASQGGAAPSPDPVANSPATPQSPSPPAAAKPGVPDLSCKVAGDCTVKDVGNCCGYFPACVNKDSPVDPEAVRAECAGSGMSAVCGFQDIQACECVRGQCTAASADTPLPVTR